MGVLRCHRSDCENVMCTRYSDKHGYICNECFEELLNSDINSIEEFLESEKNYKNKDFRAARIKWLNEEFTDC